MPAHARGKLPIFFTLRITCPSICAGLMLTPRGHQVKAVRLSTLLDARRDGRRRFYESDYQPLDSMPLTTIARNIHERQWMRTHAKAIQMIGDRRFSRSSASCDGRSGSHRLSTVDEAVSCGGQHRRHRFPAPQGRNIVGT